MHCLFFFLEVPIDHSDLVADLLKELSNHNERVEERKAALLELLKITREDSLGVWDEHFKTILLLLLETLGDKDVSNLIHSAVDEIGKKRYQQAALFTK